MSITQTLSPFDSSKQAIEGTAEFRANASYSWSWLIEHTNQQIALINQINSTVSDMNSLAQTVTTKAQEVANNTSIVNQAKIDAQAARDAALNAKSAVETIYDTFDDRYLGSKTTAPTLDNDGNALQSGALYFNSTSGKLFIYDLVGAKWVDITIIPTLLSSLSDVALVNKANNDVLQYDSASGKWINAPFEDRLGANIISATTTTIGTKGLGDYIHITGTTTITSFGNASAAGIRRTLIFDGALTLTHNATSLICPGGASITTIAGTVIEVVAETTANWRVVSVTHPNISHDELGYLDGVTSPIQTQLDLKISTQQFDKPASGPLLIKVSPSSIKIPAGFKYTSGVNSYKLVTDYTLTLASNLVGSTKTAGTDYFVYAKSDGTFYISASDVITTDRLIGGFHYGLVGETETVTGNKTEAMMVEQRGIWSASCWDLKFRPSSSVRGKNFAHGIWVDIYLADEDIAIRGYSSPWKSAGVKAKIAAGTTDYGRGIPKIPLAFGGNGTLTYGKFTWFQAAEIAASLKCFLIDYEKFPSLAYGVLENVSSSVNGYETTAGAIEHYPNLTSRYMEQATGVQWIWGADLANYPTDTTWAWKANTDSRGQIYSTENSPTAVVLGGNRDYGVDAGSRASVWNSYVWNSDWLFGCRFACGHFELV